jgi:hypothetical protein
LLDAFLSDIGIGSGSGVWRGVEKARGKSNWKKGFLFLVWFGMKWLGWLDWIGLICIFIWLDAWF